MIFPPCSTSAYILIFTMAGDMFRIMSLNCRGLRDTSKRKDVLNYIRKKNFSICCIQDTHFIQSDEKIIRAQWGFECIFSHGRSDARGVCILLNNNFEYKLLGKFSDEQGNLLILQLEVDKKFTVTLVNIYGPNKDDPIFLQNLNKRLETWRRNL